MYYQLEVKFGEDKAMINLNDFTELNWQTNIYFVEMATA